MSAAGTQTITATWADSDGSAHAGVDYTAGSGTLTFPPGVLSQTFTIPVLDDNQTNETSPETVNVRLTGATGANLGSPSTATLSISEDNDVVPTVQFGMPSYAAMEG